MKIKAAIGGCVGTIIIMAIVFLAGLVFYRWVLISLETFLLLQKIKHFDFRGYNQCCHRSCKFYEKIYGGFFC